MPAMRAPYEPTWSSLDARPIPEWYRDAKFGIFIHWGVYSVPAFAPVGAKGQNPYSEWYWHSLTEGERPNPNGLGADTAAFHRRADGETMRYEDFAPRFTAELFDADRWADLFVAAGAKYVVTTSKHHDGFTLWKSEHANRAWGRAWNSVDIGPRRDLVIEIGEASRRKGLKAGLYFSLIEWYNPLWLEDRARYVEEYLLPQFRDVVTHAEPSIVFSDGEWEMTSQRWRSPEMLAWLYNESPVADEVVVNDRWGRETRHVHGGYFTTEYTGGLGSGSHAWEESWGIGHSYGFNRMEQAKDYMHPRYLILTLIDTVSRGGNLLLDIGPAADGTIPVVMEERLRAIGAWLRVHGEAIYGTRGGTIARQWSAGAVPEMKDETFMSDFSIVTLVDTPAKGMARVDVFFTTKEDAIYAFFPRWPGGTFALHGIALRPDAKATLLSGGHAIEATDVGGLVELAFTPQPHQVAFVVKLEGARFL